MSFGSVAAYNFEKTGLPVFFVYGKWVALNAVLSRRNNHLVGRIAGLFEVHYYTFTWQLNFRHESWR